MNIMTNLFTYNKTNNILFYNKKEVYTDGETLTSNKRYSIAVFNNNEAYLFNNLNDFIKDCPLNCDFEIKTITI